MPDRRSYGEVSLDVTAGRERSEAHSSSETPFRIAILGDFTGRGARKTMEVGEVLAAKKPVMVDRDNFDSVLAKMAPHFDLRVGGPDGIPIAVKFADIDDFHPDNLFRRLAIFQKLHDTRDKLSDSATFAQTASDLGIKGAAPKAAAAAAPAPRRDSDAKVQQALAGNLLDEMLDATVNQGDQPVRRADPWTSLVREIMAPHVVPKPDPRQSEAIALVDMATTVQMNALLHLPAFQALEAAWRAVFFLVRNIETSSQLKIMLIDVSKAELLRDLTSSDDLSATGTYRLLVEKSVGTPGAEPWAVLAGNYTFDATPEDAELLHRLATVAAAARAPFISAANPALLGTDSVADLPDRRKWKNPPTGETAAMWKLVRGFPEARYLGLAMPGFLMRLPYGKDTETTELFDFEEMADATTHEDFLWANPVFAAVLLLAQSFSEEAWEMHPGSHLEIKGVPIHVHTEDGEARSTPCAEVLMTQTAAEEILERGFMPLVSMKDQPVIRLLRFQSFADPLSPLAGRWKH